MIRTIVFDLNGVIFSTGHQIRQRLISEGFDSQKIYDAIHPHGIWAKKYISGDISYERYEQEVQILFPKEFRYVLSLYMHRHPLTFSRDFLLHQFIEPYQLEVNLSVYSQDQIEMLSLLPDLAKKYTLILFSGNMREGVMMLDQEFHYLQYFTSQIFSYDYGADKPSRKMFEALISSLPNSTNESLYIDDRDKNIEIGKSYGFHTVLVPPSPLDR